MFEDIIITVGKARPNLWLQAIEEVNSIKSNIIEMKLPIDIASVAASPLYKVYHNLFGSSSTLCLNLCRQLQLTKMDYLYFMFTFLLSCKNQQPVGMMHSSMEINSEMLMPLKKYTKIWNSIKEQEGNSKQIELWKILENAVNQQLKLLFMSSDEQFSYLLGFDDDKLHFEHSKKTKMSGLGRQHHVKDNRKGLTLHTCAFSATCVPVAVSFQRFGESVQDTYIRTMCDLFGAGVGGVPELHNVTLASDRGYWEKSLLFGKILDGGADVIGTVKRVSCRIFVFFFVAYIYFFICKNSCCVHVQSKKINLVCSG